MNKLLLLLPGVLLLNACEKEANCHRCIVYADTLKRGNPYFPGGNVKDTTVCGPDVVQKFTAANNKVDTEIGYIPTSSGIAASAIARTWHTSCD